MLWLRRFFICIIYSAVISQLFISYQVQRSCQLVHSGPRLAAQQEMDASDYWQKSRCKSTVECFKICSKSHKNLFFPTHDVFPLSSSTWFRPSKTWLMLLCPVEDWSSWLTLHWWVSFLLWTMFSFEFVLCLYCRESFYDCSVIFNFLQPLMVDTLPSPFNDEIKGIATASGIPLGKKTQMLSTHKMSHSSLLFIFIFAKIYNILFSFL